MAITDKLRNEAEFFILNFMDELDKTGENSEYLKEHFAKMNNAQFEKWMKKDYPLQLQVRAFEIEPKFKDYQDAARVIGINLVEKVALPYLYKDDNGNPIVTKEALISFEHLKKMQQMVTKKNKESTDIDNRDMKSGRLNTEDKGAATGDKEMECLHITGLTKTAEEFSTIRADYMDAKSQAYASITATGTLSRDDYDLKREDGLANNLISSYLVAAHIDSNLINKDGYTPYTLKERSMRTSREN